MYNFIIYFKYDFQWINVILSLVFKPHTHFVFYDTALLLFIYSVNNQMIISYCLTYPRRYMYNTCCISMILIIKCKTHNIYSLYYAIILYKYYTIHFLCGKYGVSY